MESHLISFFGYSGVGKSTCVLQLIQDKFVEGIDRNFSYQYRKQFTIDELPCRLYILDAEPFGINQAVDDTHITRNDGFILIYSVTDRKSFDSISNIYHCILRTKNLNTVPIVIVGNKCDLESERQVSKSEGEELANILKCPFFETSGKNGSNIHNTLFQIVRIIRQNINNDEIPRK